jgi:hypothetical protein
MFRTSSVPIIRGYPLYTRQLVRFVQGMWPLPSRVRLERHINTVRLSALHTGHLYPQEMSVVLISFSEAGRIKSMKNPNDPIGNRMRNLPAYSAVPQPTAPPCTSFLLYSDFVILKPGLRYALLNWHMLFYSRPGLASNAEPSEHQTTLLIDRGGGRVLIFYKSSRVTRTATSSHYKGAAKCTSLRVNLFSSL